jgi:signal transduction histidine kinase
MRRETVERIAAALGASSFITAPSNLGREQTGRVYVTSHRYDTFNGSDADFLYQVMRQVIPVIENVRLVDRLASDAAEAERQRIARDLHDSIIQPYIGLQLGLSALQNPCALSDEDLERKVDHLLELTNTGIAELRGYVGGLKQSGGRQTSLLPAVYRFASKFSEATGIDVSVQAGGPLQISDRLAAEAFQIVEEGLSNVRRHTRALQAVVRLYQQDSCLVLQIQNPRDLDQPTDSFVPRSISERAAALGGMACVVDRNDGLTVVKVEVPL